MSEFRDMDLYFARYTKRAGRALLVVKVLLSPLLIVLNFVWFGLSNFWDIADGCHHFFMGWPAAWRNFNFPIEPIPNKDTPEAARARGAGSVKNTWDSQPTDNP